MEKVLHKRNYSLDIARIVAVLAVIMIHCSSVFVANYPLFTNEKLFGNLFDSVSQIGVPLFLMISGSLFLDETKKVTIKTILSKNVKSIAIITIIWSIIYSVVYNIILPLFTINTINVRNLIGNFIAGIINGHYHMWYLYMIIGLYIITPFLKKSYTKKIKEWFCFL